MAVFTILILLRLELVFASTGSSTSDYGKFALKANGDDSYIYFTDELDEREKVHIIVSIPNCKCVGTADIAKINQLDYFALKNYVSSFSVYVHYNYDLKLPASHCPLNAVEIQQRTELEFNSPGLVILSEAEVGRRRQESAKNFTIDFSAFLPGNIPKAETPPGDYSMSDPSGPRIEGVVLLNAIVDYFGHSYVKDNYRKMAEYGGGFLFTQGNVEMRPCYMQTQQPWILNDYEERHVIKYTERSTVVKYYNKDAAAIFNRVLNELIEEGKITKDHLLTLKVNNLESYNLVTFPFQALYIPYTWAWVFAEYVERFAYTGLSPYIYIPFIFEILWVEDLEWKYYTRVHNLTIRMGQPLLKTCEGASLKATVKNTDIDAAQSLYYYGTSGCQVGYDIEYITKKAKLMGVFIFYEVMFYIMLGTSIISMCVCFRKYVIKGICCAARKAGVAQGYHKLTNTVDVEMDKTVHKT